MNRADRALRWLPALLLVCLGADAAQPPPEPILPAELLVLHKIRTQADQVGNLAFVDLASGKVVSRIPLGREPHEVAVSSDGKYALAANTGAYSNPGNTLSLIDLATRKEARRIDLGAIWNPHGVTYRDGRFYFTAEGSRVIGAYDPEKDHLVWVMGTGQDTTHNLVFTPDGKHLFATNRGSNSVTHLELTGDPLAVGKWKSTIIPVCRSPQGLDASPDGRELWAGCRGSNEIAVINVADNKVVSTFATQTQQLARLRFTPDGKRMLVADIAGEFSIWDAATHKPLKRLKLGSYCEGILITPDGKRAFVGVTTDDNVAEIDLQTMEVVRRLQTGQGPDGMAWIGAR
jgi:DNA-binding beta-propeller fold protein YncE